MARTFEDGELELLTGRLRHLVDRSADHEARLVSLVGLAEHAHSPDLLSRIHEACVAARDQRQFTEHLLRSLNGLADAAALDPAPVRVLVVDDAEDTREILALVLGAAGLEAITASDGLEAVVAAHTLRPAVILMDLNMPVLDGIEAARLLKAAHSTRHVHLIAHTARPAFYESPSSRLFEHVLQKPASPAEVVASVRRFLESSPPPPAA